MDKELKFNADARDSLLKGMGVLAEAVGSTLGPKGQCVVIDDYADGKPLVTKDGVTVAKSIQLENKFENLGCQLLKEASVKSLELSGDGTTTSVVLAYKMISEASKLIKQGANPILLKNEIKGICDKISKEIRNLAIPVKDGDLEKIATISANNDPEIGKLIADAFDKITTDGVITVEESPSIRTYVDVITGMQFDRGFESPYFATDQIKGTCNYEKVLIFLTDRKIQLTKELVPALEIAVKENRPILIIAQDYDDEVIQNLKLNKLRGIVNVCAVKAPSYGEYRKAILEDLAILTGSTVITYESGIEPTKVTKEMLGSCDKIVVTKENTTIAGGKGSEEMINARVEQLKQQLENLSDTLDRDFMKDFIAQRIARLKGGIGVIYVGGTTELEMREKKDRIDDAVCATKSAIEEGIVPGGGISFMNAANKAIGGYDPYSDAYTVGERMIFESCSAVFDQILKNCGENPNLIIDPSNNIGYDANNGEIVNMLDAGIINPAKCDRLAFENAVSVLNLYLSANCLITNKEIAY